MFFKELQGKEVIDSSGEKVGFIDDIVFNETGQVTHLIALPSGIINKMKGGTITIQFDDVSSIEDVVFLNTILKNEK